VKPGKRPFKSRRQWGPEPAIGFRPFAQPALKDLFSGGEKMQLVDESLYSLAGLIGRESLLTYFQPIVSVKKKSVIGL
jgi:hypothetical protein